MFDSRFVPLIAIAGLSIFPGATLFADKTPPVPAFENSIGQTMIPVKAGAFTMGSAEGETGRGRDEDQVDVEITQPFFLGETEITQSQWTDVMATTITEQVNDRSGPIGRGANLVSEASAEGPNEPMVFVSWEDAVAFCQVLTEREHESGALPKDLVYTLPTEAQWEYACRAGTGTVFSHGDTLSSDEANFYGKIPYGLEGEGEYPEKTLPVKSFAPNPWGLYEMHGNVYEWCLDWYSEKAPGGKDPNVTTEGDGRNIRGGTWNRKGTSCRSAYRYSALPTRRTYNIGFRIAAVSAKE